ncbi:MAG: Rrf2 family transcriptional regulator [Lentisphaerae bacterium]|jgi:Rrf2 family transcriptional regulator, cysteine metabolism repressor|nr:Rrf2 family transcriptional regulator [Lentisphaerota bacterium]MBT5610837.1 Rrf2 family transcriptional regulator [Lentisphaerota bacterium]MBT7053731.1 Rrf2 family transcriptional regulator [Lentisphaerota bacterium]MBT7841192.1 Rrf2 family transcriptional regulator [Lentisphaerota bacterium]
MALTQKAQYALRAVYELAVKQGRGPIRIAEIATEQAIPRKFLEVILYQLKQAGVVTSKRGKAGGYYLAKPAEELTIGVVLRFMQGPTNPVENSTRNDDAVLPGHCVFTSLWAEVDRAVSTIYDGTTFRDLIDRQRALDAKTVRDYSI